MLLDDVVMLAAPTVRSQAYLQGLVANDLLPACVIAMGDTGSPEGDERSVRENWNGIELPDPNEPVATTCRRAGVPLLDCHTKSVNAPDLISAVRKAGAKLVVYSGYGGQIVGPDMLAAAPQFLHVHSGWLPQYRGSTTIYYALLRGERPGVTAFILDRGIDTGAIVARRHYPKPSLVLDVDRIYDAAIRADMLVRIMSAYAQTGRLPNPEPQLPVNATDYYVIHPVLKHVALLALES